MTDRENIIRMARDAGSIDSDEVIETVFAAFASYIREIEFKLDWNNYRQGAKDGAAAAREACVQACESLEGSARLGFIEVGIDDDTVKVCVAAIRATGQA